ncbi:DUF1273 domain-containing protein [Ectobacillus antri]|jgi:uncharacterized phage-like protein YoqJ|uniref:UPF0398 protein P6P90_02220 n=1 Tax=Ectobacillus antri TaxID=2486280 RepID=A0ABT6H0U2_9BACI|nr:DUF1273 domain-containing protein [Ectobacillus antri]MDG4656143.1 DUF1273 domain-containing protein [Ectobacillus antri]MDG5752818.1 DUF1273 domain-containing protein [Ectobacillus antri]
MRILAVTGYKPFELGIFSQKHPAIEYIKTAIRQALLSFLEEGLEWVIISGQLGVELWAAEVVFELQMDFPNLKIGVFTPFLEQEEKWNEANKEYYEFVMSQVDHIDSITKKKYEHPQQFQMKTRFFIEKSEALLAVYDEEKEGSPKFMIQQARKQQNYPCYLIDFAALQSIIEEEQWKQQALE